MKIAKELYGIKVDVFFRKTYGLRGIFRDKDTHPYSMKDENKWLKSKLASITFNEIHYRKEGVYHHAWKTMVHEVSHYEEGVVCNKKTYRISHSKKFRSIEGKNLRKVEYLRKEFEKEIKYIEF